MKLFDRDYVELRKIQEASTDTVLLIWATPEHKPYLMGIKLRNVEWRACDDGTFDCFDGADYIGPADSAIALAFLTK